MAALLSMDSVAAAEVENVLDKFNHDFALVRIAGTVVGTVDGSATEMEVRGVYLFDRKLHRVTRFNLAVKEKRSIGGATPGLDGVAKLRMNLRPLESSPHLPPDTLAALASKQRLQLDTIRLEPEKQGYPPAPRSPLVRHQPGTRNHHAPLRRPRRYPGPMHDHQPAAQERRPPHHARRIRTRHPLRAQSRTSASSFPAANGPTPSATTAWKWSSAAPPKKCRSNGTTIWWPRIDGNRVSVAVTIQGEMVSRLAAADRNLVNAIELLPAAKSTDAKSTETAARPGVSR